MDINEIHRRKVKWKSTKKEKEILQKLKKWVDQKLNRNEQLICVKEKALCNIKMKCLKIKEQGYVITKYFRKTKECSIERHKGRSS